VNILADNSGQEGTYYLFPQHPYILELNAPNEEVKLTRSAPEVVEISHKDPYTQQWSAPVPLDRDWTYYNQNPQTNQAAGMNYASGDSNYHTTHAAPQTFQAPAVQYGSGDSDNYNAAYTTPQTYQAPAMKYGSGDSNKYATTYTAPQTTHSNDSLNFGPSSAPYMQAAIQPQSTGNYHYQAPQQQNTGMNYGAYAQAPQQYGYQTAQHSSPSAAPMSFTPQQGAGSYNQNHGSMGTQPSGTSGPNESGDSGTTKKGSNGAVGVVDTKSGDKASNTTKNASGKNSDGNTTSSKKNGSSKDKDNENTRNKSDTKPKKKNAGAGVCMGTISITLLGVLLSMFMF